jgi:hypothetical protein
MAAVALAVALAAAAAAAAVAATAAAAAVHTRVAAAGRRRCQVVHCRDHIVGWECDLPPLLRAELVVGVACGVALVLVLVLVVAVCAAARLFCVDHSLRCCFWAGLRVEGGCCLLLPVARCGSHGERTASGSDARACTAAVLLCCTLFLIVACPVPTFSRGVLHTMLYLFFPFLMSSRLRHTVSLVTTRV